MDIHIMHVQILFRRAKGALIFVLGYKNLADWVVSEMRKGNLKLDHFLKIFSSHETVLHNFLLKLYIFV